MRNWRQLAQSYIVDHFPIWDVISHKIASYRCSPEARFCYRQYCHFVTGQVLSFGVSGLPCGVEFDIVEW